MEEILKAIADAEAEAARKKAAAQAEADEIVRAAQTRAAEEMKNAELSLKNYRERSIKVAEAVAEEHYAQRIRETTDASRGAADKILENTKSAVSAIVRRVVDGNSRHA